MVDATKVTILIMLVYSERMMSTLLHNWQSGLDNSQGLVESGAAYCRTADVSDLIVWERLSQLTRINA